MKARFSVVLAVVAVLLLLCASGLFADRGTTNALTLTGTTFLRSKTEAHILPNLFNVSGQYDTVVIVIEGSYVFSNGTTVIKAPVVNSRSYNLLELLGYNTNVWTNVMERLIFTPVP